MRENHYAIFAHLENFQVFIRKTSITLHIYSYVKDSVVLSDSKCNKK